MIRSLTVQLLFWRFMVYVIAHICQLISFIETSNQLILAGLPSGSFFVNLICSSVFPLVFVISVCQSLTL